MMIAWRRLLRVAWAAAALALSCQAGSALAWGRLGHHVIVELAYERLTPAARTDFDSLLALAPQQETPSCPVANLDDSSTWADCVRANEPALKKALNVHHTDRIPVCGPIVRAQYCAGEHCASGDIERFAAILHDRGANPIDRLHALEIVVHVVGDIHQPMHAVATDASRGNPVSIPDDPTRPMTLHGAWDSALVKAAMIGGKATMASMRAGIQAGQSQWASGSPAQWALETNQIARRVAIGALPVVPVCGVAKSPTPLPLTPAYYATATPVVRQQLEKAAVRLAWMLNAELPAR